MEQSQQAKKKQKICNNIGASTSTTQPGVQEKAKERAREKETVKEEARVLEAREGEPMYLKVLVCSLDLMAPLRRM